MKAASKGNKAQGGEANRRPNTATAGTDPNAEQGLEGQGPFDTTGTAHLETGSSRGSRIEEDRKSEEATTMVTWNGCGWRDSSGG